MPRPAGRNEPDRPSSGQQHTRTRPGDRHHRSEDSRCGHYPSAQVAAPEKHNARGYSLDVAPDQDVHDASQGYSFPSQVAEAEGAVSSSRPMRYGSSAYGQYGQYSSNDPYGPSDQYDHRSEYSREAPPPPAGVWARDNDDDDEELTPKGTPTASGGHTDEEAEGNLPMQDPRAAQQQRLNRSLGPPDPGHGSAEPASSYSRSSYGDVPLEPHAAAEGSGADDSWQAVPGESSLYYDRARDPSTLMVQPTDAGAPPMYYPAEHSIGGLIPPAAPFAPLRNDLTINIANCGPLLVCIRNEGELSYINARVSAQLGLETHPLPKAKRRQLFTPLGTYEPEAYSVFFADIEAFGVRNREFKMLNLAWDDTSLAQVIIGRKLLLKIQGERARASRAGYEPNAAGYSTSQSVPASRRHGNSHSKTARWERQPYALSEDQSSQLLSPTQFSSIAAESGPFTGDSVPSTHSSDVGDCSVFSNPSFTLDDHYDYDPGTTSRE